MRRNAAKFYFETLEVVERMAPQVGLEPTTLRLTAGCSAIELLRNTVRREAPVQEQIA